MEAAISSGPFGHKEKEMRTKRPKPCKEERGTEEMDRHETRRGSFLIDSTVSRTRHGTSSESWNPCGIICCGP